MSLQSLPDEGERTDRLQVEITGIDLKKLTEISPFLPDLSGILHTDLLLYTDRKTFGAEGNIGVLFRASDGPWAAKMMKNSGWVPSIWICSMQERII